MQERRHRRLADLPYWLLALALLGVLAMWGIVRDQDYFEIFRMVSGGIGVTLWVTLAAFAPAVLLGLLIALMRTSGAKALEQAATFYTEFVRGVPVLVLLFYVAFVAAPAMITAGNWLTQPLQQLGLMPELTIKTFDFTWRAVVALAICYSAFLSEVFRAGLQAVPAEQIEAGLNLGASRSQVFRLIVAPTALRLILPPLGNDFVSLIKDSALVSTLGVLDITQIGKLYSAATFNFFKTYNVIAFLYLTMTICLSLGVRFVERRLHRD